MYTKNIQVGKIAVNVFSNVYTLLSHPVGQIGPSGGPVLAIGPYVWPPCFRGSSESRACKYDWSDHMVRYDMLWIVYLISNWFFKDDFTWMDTFIFHSIRNMLITLEVALNRHHPLPVLYQPLVATTTNFNNIIQFKQAEGRSIYCLIVHV